MSEVIDAEHRRHDQLVAALVEPHGAETHIATLLSQWLSDREVAALCGWVTRARDERVGAYRAVLARVLVAVDDATRDTEGRYVVLLGPTLVRHLFDLVPAEGSDS